MGRRAYGVKRKDYDIIIIIIIIIIINLRFQKVRTNKRHQTDSVRYRHLNLVNHRSGKICGFPVIHCY